jgi:hypothetical protein
MKSVLTSLEIYQNMRIGDSYTEYLKRKGRIPKNHMLFWLRDTSAKDAVEVYTAPRWVSRILNYLTVKYYRGLYMGVHTWLKR